MKRIIALALAAMLSISCFASYEGHWAEGLITKWMDLGLIGGYPDGSFKPNNNITRAEFAKLLSSVTEERDAVGDASFSDVLEDDWFYYDVMRLAYFGIIAPNDKFYPNRYITREEAMVMVSRAKDIFGESGAVTDADEISDWAREAIFGLLENGYIGGYPDGTIRPKNNITRAESIKLLDSFVKEPDLTTLEGIMSALYARVKVELPAVMNTEINAENSEYYLGIPNASIKEGLASEPMMSAQAHSICLVRVNEGDDANALAKQISESVNPFKWICVGAENVTTVVRGDLILLVMSNAAPKSFETAFLQLPLDGEVEVLSKDAESGFFFVDGQYVNDIGTLKEDSAKKFADKVNYVIDNYLSESEKIFYAVIPSKNYYINHKLPKSFDYDKLDYILRNNINGAFGISLYNSLSFDDYLSTDFHWKQENLQGVADKLGEAMEFSVNLSDFTNNKCEKFTGQYGYGKSGFMSEQLNYLTNAATESAVVSNYQDPSFTGVYDVSKLDTKSQYDLFLSGPTPLTVIKNENAESDRELIIFRDSFASSLTPLLISEYSEITLIDLRYVVSTALAEIVDFHGQEVLFLFNDQIINSSDMLK